MQVESKKIESIIRYWILLEELKRQKEKLRSLAEKQERGVAAPLDAPGSDRMPELVPVR